MDLIHELLHLDKFMDQLVGQYGQLTYLLLFLIVFAETGLVVTPFLPGDSLLFAAGAIAARNTHVLNVWLLAVILFAAAVLGDSVNYWVGRAIGPRLFRGDTFRWLNQEHLDKTHAFYEKYGPKTIILARFVPIVRTFAPFVAGIGSMTYATFMTYNILGGALWVLIGIFAGFFFGGLPVIRDNFSIVVLAVVFISLLPIAYEWWQYRRHKATAAPSA